MWKEAERFLAKDKYIGPLVTKYGSCQIKKRPKTKYFVSLVRAISGQQLSVKAAQTIYGRLEKLLGEVTPDNVLKRHDKTLRGVGLSWAKVSYVKDLARKVKNGELEINKLDKLDNEKIKEELINVKGIGPWSAEMFMMFTLGRPDIFPIDDLGIRNGLKRLVSEDIVAVDMVVLAQRWKPYRTCASWYIWRSLEND